MRVYNEMSRRRLTIKELKELYRIRLRETGQPLMLYIDTPFCMKICTFCNCRPFLSHCGGKDYYEYYKYLLSLLDSYKDLIEEFPPTEIYFGGGTPFLMDTKIMTAVFEAIPGFLEIPYKMIEGHPALMAESKMKLLSKNKFSYVSLGVQTFDESTLISQNRIGFNFEKVKDKIARVRADGAVVNCDLITYLNGVNKGELIQLRKDLNTMRELGPDMVSCHYDFYKLKTTQDEKGNLITLDSEMIRAVKRYRSEIVRFVRKNNYTMNVDMKYFLSDKAIRESPTLTPPIYLSNKREGHTYTCSGYPNFAENEIVLGLGGYENHITYGHINTEFNYEIRMANSEVIIEEIY